MITRPAVTDGRLRGCVRHVFTTTLQCVTARFSDSWIVSEKYLRAVDQWEMRYVHELQVEERAYVELSVNNQSLVLIVEDEALIRMSAVDMIEQTGRGIVEAVDADEAIDILTSRTDIGFLFTDVEMPGSMDGLELARAVHDRWPGIAIIVTSGRRRPRQDDLPVGGRFITKPYEALTVARTIFELDAQGSSDPRPTWRGGRDFVRTSWGDKAYS